MVLELPGMEDRGMEHRIMLLCAVLVCALVSFLDVANKKKGCRAWWNGLAQVLVPVSESLFKTLRYNTIIPHQA